MENPFILDVVKYMEFVQIVSLSNVKVNILKEEKWNPIEDIKAAIKLLEENGIYNPSGNFKISKELYEYLFSTGETKD